MVEDRSQKVGTAEGERMLARPTALFGKLRRALRLVAVNSFAAAYIVPHPVRRAVYRACGYDVADDATVFAHTIIRSESLSIGRGSFVNHFCLFGDGAISLGEYVFIGAHTVLTSSDHVPGGPLKRAGADVLKPITIENGAWIGAHVTVLGGVTIAHGCIIGAGAVVTRSTEPDGVYVGTPARRIRDLSS